MSRLAINEVWNIVQSSGTILRTDYDPWSRLPMVCRKMSHRNDGRDINNLRIYYRDGISCLNEHDGWSDKRRHLSLVRQPLIYECYRSCKWWPNMHSGNIVSLFRFYICNTRNFVCYKYTQRKKFCNKEKCKWDSKVIEMLFTACTLVLE